MKESSTEFKESLYLPITIRIAGAKILIIGGGKVATHKATLLSRFTHHATLIAPEITDDIKALPFEWKEKSFEASDLKGVDLLYVCTGDHDLNRHIKQLAAEQGILTSVCDDPQLCDFISPAIYRKDNLTIAVGSDAQDVRRSIRVRDHIEENIDNGKLSIQ